MLFRSGGGQGVVGERRRAAQADRGRRGLVGDVERHLRGCFITKDLFGFADIFATSPSRGNLLVQATSGTGRSNLNAHLIKVRSEPKHAICLAAGNRIQVHHWQKVKGQTERELHVVEILKAPTL